jgi:DNA sulfur modification protein DndD
MILERIKLENFRQFKGSQDIILSDLRGRNVTVVHAENGAGKTTILKAILWALYGHEGLRDDFEQPSNIIHEGSAFRSKDPESLAATVTLIFRHGASEKYILTRRLTLAQQNADAAKTDLVLEVMKEGQTFKVGRPQPKIHEIIPFGISAFLFFNGERIDYLAEEKNSAKVTDAIHQMLGLKLLGTTIKDLEHQSVRGKLRQELKEHTSDEKREALEELAKLEAISDRRDEELDQARANLSALDADLAAIDAKLVANKEAYELQTKREALTNKIKELRARCHEVTQRLSKNVGEDSYAVLLGERVARGKSLVAALRNEGRIPARVVNTFVQELLDAGVCICKRSLPEGSEERGAVLKQMTLAGDQSFNNAVSDLEHAIGLLTGSSGQVLEQIRALNRERGALSAAIRDCEEEIEEIHQVLGSKEDEVVAQLEDRRKKLQLSRDEQLNAVGRIEGLKAAVKQQREDLLKLISAIEDKADAAALAQRRLDLLEESAGVLKEILAAETEDLRPLLNNEIAKLFRRIMAKDYRAEITNNYTLRVLKPLGLPAGGAEGTEKEAALSTGERTVAALVFIASLVSLADKRAEIPTIMRDLTGAAYPLVIDSPFGALSVFRDGVARYVPELAPQVMLLVSPETYSGPVERALAETGRIGRRYCLIHHGRQIAGNYSPKLELNGKQYPQFVHDESDEYTEIREIEI